MEHTKGTNSVSKFNLAHEYIDFGDNLDDIERYIRQHGIPASQFSDEIKDYIDTDFVDMRAAIHSGTLDPRVARLSEQMTTQQHNLITYRSDFSVFDMEIGDVLTYRSFVSTSLHKGIAAEHGYKDRKPYPIGTFFKVHVPKSAKSLLLDTFEYELLLDKGTQLKVLDRLDIKERGKVRLGHISQQEGFDISSHLVYRVERIYIVEVIL